MLDEIVRRLSDTVEEKLAQEGSISANMAELKKPGVPYPAMRPAPLETPPPAPPMAQPAQPEPALKKGVQLTPAQIDFAKFIADRKGIGIAAWMPGAGKTLGTIASFLNLRARGEAKVAIVLVPASLRVNFAEGGVKKFTTASYGIIGNRQEATARADMDVERMGKKDFYIISHDMFRANPDYYLKKTGADTVIMDEMHRVKDPKSVLNDVIEKVGPRVRNFIGATASPAMNKPFEAIELRNVISSPEERLSQTKFTQKYIQRAPRDFWQRVRGWFGGKLTGEITGFRHKEELAKILGKAFHFAEPKTKGMPKKEVQVIDVPMTLQQEKNYHRIMLKKLTSRERKILREGQLYPDREMIKILNKVMATRQLSNNARWVEGDSPINAASQTPKMLRMIRDISDHLKKRPDGQIIVASNFVGSGVRLMEAMLLKKGITFGRYYGKGQEGITGETREQAIRNYNTGKIKVMIMSGAGAEGLDLPNTTMHLTMDPHYNPERITQQEARGIRRGGQAHIAPEKRKVIVKRYVSSPRVGFSIEKSIYEIAAKKKALVDQLKQIGLQAQRERAQRDPGRARALALFSKRKQPVKMPMQPVEAQKVAASGGYGNTRGSFDSGEVRLITGGSNLMTFGTMKPGGDVFPYYHTQQYLPGKWSKKKRDSTVGAKERAKMKFTGKTEGELGPGEDQKPIPQVGY